MQKPNRTSLDWTEKEYYLCGLKLQEHPISWGVIEEVDRRIELFHINGAEEAQLEKTDGFVGYWADDLLTKEWADKVFECYVWAGEGSSRYPMRIKRCDMAKYDIKSEINPETDRWFHPHEFLGVPVWNKNII